MKKLLLIIILSVTGLVLLAAAVLGVLVSTFNPNDYKGEIASAVEKATGRPLRFDGTIEMTLFPTLGLKTGKLSLLDPGEFGAEPLLVVENASLALALEPLFNNVLAVENVTLQGARLKLVKTATGRANWDYGFGRDGDAASGDAAKAPPSGVTPLAPPPPPVESKSKTNFALRIQEIACTDLQVVYRDLASNAAYSGRVDSLAVSGADLDKDIPLDVTGSVKDETSGREASFSLKASVRANGNGNMAAKVTSLTLAAQGLADTPLNLRAEGSLAYDSAARAASVDDLRAELALPAGQGGSKAVSATVQGHILFTAGQPPALTGELHLSALDLDALLVRMRAPSPSVSQESPKGAPNLTNPKVRGKEDSGKGGPADKKEASKGGAFPDIKTDLALKADSLLVEKIPLSAVQLRVETQDKQVRIPYSMSLFDGTATGQLKADLRQAVPALALACELKGLNLESATRALSGRASISGPLNGSLNVTGAGATAQAITASLKGTASARAGSGEIRGFTLIPGDLPGLKPIPANFPYTLISASANISQGTATTKDITLQSPVLTGRGGGTVLLAFSQMDLGIEFMLAGLPPAVPVSINGPFNALSYGVDMRTFLRNVAESAAQSPESTAKELIRGVGGLLFKK